MRAPRGFWGLDLTSTDVYVQDISRFANLVDLHPCTEGLRMSARLPPAKDSASAATAFGACTASACGSGCCAASKQGTSGHRHFAEEQFRSEPMQGPVNLISGSPADCCFLIKFPMPEQEFNMDMCGL